MQISSTLVACAAIIPMSVATITLYFAINYNVQIHERVLFFIAFILSNCVLILFHLLGEVYLISIKLIDSWRFNYIGTCSHWQLIRRRITHNNRWQIERRQFKACRPLKYIALLNYPIDKLTGLRIIDTIIDKSVVLLKAFPLH